MENVREVKPLMIFFILSLIDNQMSIKVDDFCTHLFNCFQYYRCVIHTEEGPSFKTWKSTNNKNLVETDNTVYKIKKNRLHPLLENLLFIKLFWLRAFKIRFSVQSRTIKHKAIFV